MKKAEMTVDFNEMVDEIEQGQILLPDFQRKFSWTGKEVQAKLAASVLCKMPIGSILLLKLPANEYAVRRIGSNDLEDFRIEKGEEREFLLDGQQRVTVMVNLFSNLIHEQKTSRIDSLKRRGFLGIAKPSRKEKYEDDDWGLKSLHFPLADPEKDSPDLLTEDIADTIFLQDFAKNKPAPYSPYGEEKDNQLLSYCLTGQEGFYLIPLYLLVKRKNEKIRHGNQRLLQRILQEIAKSQETRLVQEYDGMATREAKEEWLKTFFGEESERENLLEKRDDLMEMIQRRSEDWAKDMEGYLRSCLAGMHLHVMGVPNSSRSKAIEVFENMNRGGVKLSAFDLVMARGARNNRDFRKNLDRECAREGIYRAENVPARIRSYYEDYKRQKQAEKGVFNALCDMNCIDENGEYSKIFQDTFLNVLSLQCHRRKKLLHHNYREEMGREKILNLTSQEINENFAPCCRALDQAAFFLKARCGVRSITEVNYKLMYTVLSYLFLEDEVCQSEKVWNLLAAWYWNIIFSGGYNRDQNTQAAKDMKFLETIIREGKDSDKYVESIHEKAWKASDFSDKDFLLYRIGKETDNYPKEVLGQYICQFYLSEGYDDVLPNEEGQAVFLCTFADDKTTGKLEKHHMIPKASFQSVREAKRWLKTSDGKKNIVNSPLNTVFISERANKRIAACDYACYVGYLQSPSIYALDFPTRIEISEEQEISTILEVRFKRLEVNLQKKTREWMRDWQGGV